VPQQLNPNGLGDPTLILFFGAGVGCVGGVLGGGGGTNFCWSLLLGCVGVGVGGFGLVPTRGFGDFFCFGQLPPFFVTTFFF